MTRPKVPADKRIRTAQACDTCKRRKQKCNGLQPCTTCSKRSLTCTYIPSTNNGQDTPEAPPTPASKRRHVEVVSPMRTGSSDSIQPAQLSPATTTPPLRWDSRSRHNSDVDQAKLFEARSPPQIDHGIPHPDNDLEVNSRNSTVSGPDEETQMFYSTRMLMDPTGRLVYVGDSASLAYLQLIRMIVDARSGSNEFTLDPDRHKIMEATSSVSSDYRPPALLPQKETADVLINAFFTNTHGLIKVVNRRDFEMAVEECYAQPLLVQSQFLCLLNLMFAIGTVMGTPLPGTKEDHIFRELRMDPHRSELFYRNAKSLAHPSTGLENADLWSIQALSLMAVYSLAVCRRNEASASLGMAIRSAFALGLHRVQENHSIFKSEDVKMRRNLWRSLFVLDRFVATSLGRPAAIAEDECSEDALLVFEKNAAGELIPIPDPTSGLDAAVRISQVIGQILKRIYARRRVSLRLAQEMAEQCKVWASQLHPSLHHRQVQAHQGNHYQAIAALHVNLLYSHAIVLLTRPFFIYLLSKVHNERCGLKLPVPRWLNRTSKYCEACFIASNHTISLVQHAFDAEYLPQRNPFILYCLFAASLNILSNEFGAVYANPTYAASVTNSINIMRYCAQTDPQAERLIYILESFRVAVAKVRTPGDNLGVPTPGLGSLDPMADLFTSSSSRKSSFVMAAPPPPAPSSSMSSRPEAGKNLANQAHGAVSVAAGVSPASSAAASSLGARETDGTDEVDFDNLWGGPWNAGHSVPAGDANGNPVLERPPLTIVGHNGGGHHHHHHPHGGPAHMTAFQGQRPPGYHGGPMVPSLFSPDEYGP